MNINNLEKALKKSWSKNTCYLPMEKDWNENNPAYGQCYVTALIVNDYLGGKILKAKFKDNSSHFWNLINKKEIDLTRSQFKNEIIPKPTIHNREEFNIPKYKEHNKRYLILKKRVSEYLK